MEGTQKSVTGEGSALRKYQRVIVGSDSLLALLYFEFCMLLGNTPGALGLLLRKRFWPRMFRSCGRGVTFGANIVLRNPAKIRLGDNVVISEQCILDGRSQADETTITIGDNVILSNQVMLSCKNGSIHIGQDTGINAQTIIQSTNECPVTIGNDCIIGQRCFVVGGGSYNFDRLDLPIRAQGIRRDGGIRIEENVWLGGNVTVLGGVTVGRGSVMAAGAVVTHPVPEYSVCMGIPARVVKNRKDEH